MTETIIWISGATEGIGLGLARNCPHEGARIINLSRRQHPDYETVQFDLTEPESWDRAGESFAREFATFTGKRAIFIHNGYYSDSVGIIGKVDSTKYRKGVLANVAAPLVLGEAFLVAATAWLRPGREAGLAMLSSGAAVAVLPGLASYCAAKTAIEHWVEVVDSEGEDRGDARPWIVAVRPGGVATAPVHRVTAMSPEIFPRAARIAKNIPNRLDIDTCARNIWANLPPPQGISVISFAEPPPDPRLQFGHRTKLVPVSRWQLVYS